MTQYRAVREEVGLLDRSDIGKLAITGKDRFSWLQGMVSNDVRLLEQGRTSLQACVLDATGHLLSDMTLLNVRGSGPLSSMIPSTETDFVLAVLPRINLDKIAAIFDRFLIMEEVEITDVSERVATLSLQGPRAVQVWQKGAAEGDVLADSLTAAFTVEAEHTGSGGADLYFPIAEKEARKSVLLSAGIVEVGAGAQEILRVEAGLPKYGTDMDETILAPEANLSATHISLTKGCYVGQEIVARIDSRGHTNRALTGFVILGEQLPAPGDRLFPLPTGDEPSPRETGRITSIIASSPAVGGRPIALGYARHEHRTPGTQMCAGTNEEVAVEVAELPFYSPMRGCSRSCRTAFL